MKLQPLHDRIVVEAAAKEEVSAGGIILPDSAQEKPQRGSVLAVGPGKMLDSGTRAPVDVKVGDIVLYGKYSGTEVSVSGKDYVILRADDVLAVADDVSPDQEITAVLWRLAAAGRQPLLVFERVRGFGTRVVTNVFGSRARIARLLGAEPARLHEAYQARAHAACDFRVVDSGPILDSVETRAIDLAALPLLKHFATDRAPYVTSGIVVAEHPETGAGNLSYHRAMVRSKTELATSLHSRGHLWRLLQLWAERGRPMPVAMVIGAHPLFMLAASARVGFGADERRVAGGLLGAPLETVRTPVHGIAVPAAAEIVLEGTIDPKAHGEEGPFGEFTGYS